MSEVNSGLIKIALLSNYRYKKQQIAADEVGFTLGISDISAYSESGLLTEIEIKTSKSDLWQGEKAKADKHQIYRTLEMSFKGLKYPKCIIPNYFFICVPTALLDEAKKWVLTTNEKYGIIEFQDVKATNYWIPRPEDTVYTTRRAKLLHSEPCLKALPIIGRRLSSETICLKSSLREIQKSYKSLSDEFFALKKAIPPETQNVLVPNDNSEAGNKAEVHLPDVR